MSPTATRKSTARRAVVDLGCGNGRYARILAEHFDQVLGVDVSASAIAKARAESLGITGLSFEVLDAVDEHGAEALAERIGPANVLIRGVLHVLDDQARAGLADTTARLVGAAGAALVMEPAYAKDSFGYVGVRHSTSFGQDELHRFFPEGTWQHLQAENVAMHAVDPETDQGSLELPGFYAAVRPRHSGLVGAGT